MSNRTFLGKVGMTPKGEWNNSTTYERLDIVSYEGSSYIAIAENRNSVPTDSNPNWMIGAKHGEFTEEQLEEFKQEVIAESLQEIDDFTQEQKAELESYEEAKETELNNYTNDKKDDIDTHATTKINDYNTNAYKKETAFNTNETSKTNTFNSNAETKTTNFNDNATSKTNAYNQNTEDKTTAFNTNASTKQNTFDTNATQKTNTFNTNATSKTTDFNTNAASKKSDYDTNATSKLEAYNTNATEKTEAFDQNAEDKTAEFDEHVQELEEAIPLLQQETQDLLNASYKIYTETPAESVTLNKTSKNRFVKFGVAGNKYQTTYNGYQLIHQPSQNVSSEAVGLTYESNIDGTYRIYGTATANRQLMVTIEDGILRAVSSTYYSSLIAGDYTLKVETISGSGSGFVVRNSTTQITESYALEQHFTLAEDSSSINIYKFITNGTEIDWTFKIQLEKGTTAHEWEPYVGEEPSPNPTYKQDIHAVGDNINLFDKDLFGEFKTNEISTLELILKPNTTYIMSSNLPYSTSNVANLFFKLPSESYGTSTNGVTTGQTRTVTTDSTGIVNVGYRNNGGTIQGDLKNDFWYQIEEGTIATTYRPYGMGVVNIDTCNGNLFDSDNFNLVHLYLESGVLVSASAASSIYIHCKPNTNYIVKKSNAGTNTRFTTFFTDKIPQAGDSVLDRYFNPSGSKSVVTSPEGARYLGVFFATSNTTPTVQEIMDTIQIIEGTADRDYIKGESQTFNMPCQKPMVDESDYFDWDNELEVHNRNIVILDGTEEWVIATSVTSGTTRFYTEDFTNVMKTGGGNTQFVFSNAFQSLTWVQMYSSDTTTKNGISNYNNNTSPKSRIVIRIDSSIASTVEELKTWLAQQNTNGTPIQVEYILEQQEELPFTSSQKTVAEQIKNSTSYYEQTNVFSNDEVSPIYDVTAVGDLNLIIDPIDARLTLVEE